MSKEIKNTEALAKYCERVLLILNSYYDFNSIPKVENFLLPPSENSTCAGQVLFEELEEDFFIGIQFAKEIYTSLSKHDEVSAHHVSVLAEELSHFKFLSDIVEKDKQTSLLTIETLGEIDRFLCVMHWNNRSDSSGKIAMDWKNIHQICDYVFTGERFQEGNKKLYIEAENLAFKHLKEAFSDQWDCSHINFSSISKPAKNYLYLLRAKFLA